MKTSDDFRHDMGQAGPAFEASVRRTLAQLQSSEEEHPVKKLSTGLVIALSILLIVTIAVAAAAQWGIFDFLSYRGWADRALPDAQQFVETKVPQQSGATEYAAFTLREAIYDGEKTYLVVAAAPMKENVLLVGPDTLPEDPMIDLGPQFAGSTLCVADYARQQGKDMLVSVNVADRAAMQGLEGCVNSLDYILENDGSLVLMITGNRPSSGAELPIELSCYTTPLDEGAAAPAPTTLSFTLASAQNTASVSSKQSAIFADCGVEVTSVTLTASPMNTYVRIEFTVTDRDAYAKTDDGLWFEFLDENGQRIPSGTDGGGSVEPIGSDGLSFVQKESLAAMEPLPKTVTLRGYNCWEKNRYETHTFEME